MAGGGFGSFLAHSNVLNRLKDVQFPCSKQDLIDQLEDNHAHQEVIELVDKVPDKVYNSVEELREQLPG